MGFKLNYYKHFPESPKNTHYIYLKKHTLRLQPMWKGGILYSRSVLLFLLSLFLFPLSPPLSYSPHDRDRANASN